MDDAARAPGRRFWRLALVILALVIVVASPYYVLKGVQTVREAWPTPVTDFDVFYDAGALAVSDSRSHLYDPAGRREVPADNRGAIGKFFNPPGMALLHAPLSLLPRAEARLLFAAIVIAAMVATYLIATGRREDTAFLVVSGAALASFLPAYDALYLGHHTLVLGLCVAGSLLAFERGKPTLAGLLTGLLILKPSLFVLPFALLVMKDRRAAAAALVTAVVVGLAPFLVTGLHSLPDYVDLLWSTRADALRLDGERTGGASLMFNWAGFFARLFREDASPYFVWPLSILTVGLAALAWRRLPWPEAYPRRGPGDGGGGASHPQLRLGAPAGAGPLRRRPYARPDASGPDRSPSGRPPISPCSTTGPATRPRPPSRSRPPWPSPCSPTWRWEGWSRAPSKQCLNRHRRRMQWQRLREHQARLRFWVS